MAPERNLRMLDHVTGPIRDEFRNDMLADMLDSFRKGWAAAAATLRTMADAEFTTPDTAGLIHQLANVLEAALVPDAATPTPLHVEDGKKA